MSQNEIREDSRALHDLIDAEFDDESPSITQVNGTVARFGMSYAPPTEERFVFHAPLRHIAPSVVYSALAALVFAAVFLTHATAGVGPIHHYIVEADAGRALASRPFAMLLVFSALATLGRAWLRGVVVSPDGIESREVGLLGLPRVARWSWIQVDRVVIDAERGRVLVELWNGQKVVLPPVRQSAELSARLHGLAIAHRKDVTLL